MRFCLSRRGRSSPDGRVDNPRALSPSSLDYPSTAYLVERLSAAGATPHSLLRGLSWRVRRAEVDWPVFLIHPKALKEFDSHFMPFRAVFPAALAAPLLFTAANARRFPSRFRSPREERHRHYAVLFAGIARSLLLRCIFQRQLELHRLARMQVTPQSHQDR